VISGHICCSRLQFLVRTIDPSPSSLPTSEPLKEADLSPSPRKVPNDSKDSSLKRHTDIAGIDWDFNAWGGSTGGLYPDWQRDKRVASRIISEINKNSDTDNNNSTGIEVVPLFPCPIVLEGGSIHVDGLGTCLTTEECLLNPNRNPNLSKQEIESWLIKMLGVKKVIWLPRGLYGDDDTNGHIDNFACFARKGVVLLAWPWSDDEADPQFEISVKALEILESETDAEGNPLQVVKMPLPRPIYSTAEDVESVQAVDGVKTRQPGVRLAASYVNFYICNGGVVMPGLGDEDSDAKAVAVVEKMFPERKIVQVQTREVLLGGGNIHCITQQQPV
jgi:agmatine deiminase